MFSPLTKNTNIFLVPLKIYNRLFEQRHLRLAERILLPLFWSLDKILLFTARTLWFCFLFFVKKYVCIWNFMRFMTGLKVYATESNQASRVCVWFEWFVYETQRITCLEINEMRARARTHAHRKRIRNNITQSIELFFTPDDGNYTLQPNNSLMIMYRRNQYISSWYGECESIQIAFDCSLRVRACIDSIKIMILFWPLGPLFFVFSLIWSYRTSSSSAFKFRHFGSIGYYVSIIKFKLIG